jgi:hypothetical protein
MKGQTIFDARRLGWKDVAGDQSVALQIAQGLGEHALGDVADCAVKLAEALRSRRVSLSLASRLSLALLRRQCRLAVRYRSPRR